MVRLHNLISQTEDHYSDISLWLESFVEKYSIKNVIPIKQALKLASLAGASQKTFYNISCLHQGMLMAEILAPLNVDENTLAAAISYSSVQYTDLKHEDIYECLGSTIAKIVHNVMQLASITSLSNTVEWRKHTPITIENIRKMLLAMVNDIRSVLIKLAEHLCILRNITKADINIKKQVAAETTAIYAPLANRLGIGSIKWEMEDFAFRYTNPEQYKKISQYLNQRRIEREEYVEHIVQTLQKTLQVTNIKNIEIKGRVKHLFSIYRKMQKKSLSFNRIYDVTAVRIIVPTIEDCYTVLAHVHANWKSLPLEFDDYIISPKLNGYKSIHTVVEEPDGKHIEIQIRTYQMHQEAELGNAAHWMYKEGIKKDDYLTKIIWLRDLMDWQKEVAPIAGAKSLQQIFNDRIYVFTPTGEVVDLEKGSTPLDFAYHIHSDIGHRCRGAKVNGKISTLTSLLQTGDRVEILTAKTPRPSRDWINPNLGFLKTIRAKAKVHQWFKQQDYQNNIIYGRKNLEKELQRLNLKNIDFDKLAKNFNLKNSDDFFAALGSGDIKTCSIIALIQKEQTALKNKVKDLVKYAEIPDTTKISSIKIPGIGKALTSIANCCKPKYGDKIIGYLRLGRGITVHRCDCFNITRAKRIAPQKLISIYWDSQKEENKIK